MSGGFTLDEFIDARFATNNQRWTDTADPTFHSCAHCNEYRNHCKKLERKLKTRNNGWSCNDSTKCETWQMIKYEVKK